MADEHTPTIARGRPRSGLRFAAAALRTAAAGAVEQRASFIFQVVMMVINDLTWLAFWLLLFSRADTIRGWHVGDVMVLFSIFATAAGLVIGVFANTRDIGRAILAGELDPLLAHPRPVLLHFLLRRVDPPLIGDLVFGPLVFALSGHASLATIPIWICAVLLGATVFASFLVITQSSAFWLAGRTEPAELGFLAATVFAMYPATIFGGAAKVVVYTVIPTAFISTLPARLVIDFNWSVLAQIALVATCMTALAIATFHLGLRRYLRADV